MLNLFLCGVALFVAQVVTVVIAWSILSRGHVLSYKRLKSDSFYIIIKTKLVSLCIYFPAVWLLKHKPGSSETGQSGWSDASKCFLE